MPVRMTQYGIAHAHASGKVDAMKRNPEVEFCGIFEPDAQVRANKEKKRFTGMSAGSKQARRCWKMIPSSVSQLKGGSLIILPLRAKLSNMESTSGLIMMAKEKDLLIQLGYMFRYNPGFQFIFQIADERNMGDIFSVRGRMSTNIPVGRRSPLGQFKGGILFELLCHLIDIVVRLLGRPNRVVSFLRNDLGVVPEFSDNTLAVLEYERAIAVLESSAMEVSPFPARRFEVYGTKGSVIIESLEPPSIRLCLDQPKGDYVKGWQTVEIKERLRYDGELEAFVANIKGEKSSDRSLSHELIVQETLLRASKGIEGFMLSDPSI